MLLSSITAIHNDSEFIIKVSLASKIIILFIIFNIDSESPFHTNGELGHLQLLNYTCFCGY